MNLRLSFIIASILIPTTAIIVGLTNKEIRCFARLDAEEVCQSNFIEADLIVQSDKLQPIEGANVQFILKGVEARKTDSNGYVRIRIPSRKDVEVVLSKEGFQTIHQVINLAVDSQRTRIYQLNAVSSQSSPSSPNPSNSPSVTDSSLPSPSDIDSVPSSSFSASCTLVKGYAAQQTSEDISVGLRPIKPASTFLITKDAPRSVACRITQNSGVLKSTFAIPDNSTLLKVAIKFYLNGQFVKSLDLARGEVKAINLDTSKSDSYAVSYEVIASNNADYIYVID